MIRRFFSDGLHWLVVAFGIVGAAVYFSVPANADPALTERAARYAADHHAAICHTLDQHPTAAGLTGIAVGILDDGLTLTEAGQAIGVAILIGCPEHEQLLTDIVHSTGRRLV